MPLPDAKEEKGMLCEEIWKEAKKEAPLAVILLLWMQEHPEHPLLWMALERLGERYPCFMGVDPDRKMLMFRSEDIGAVGLYAEREDERNVSLLMEVGIVVRRE